MLSLVVGMMIAAQDVPPLAGTLPPMPPPPSARREDGPPRGPLFISPMGEPFRGPDPVRMWFDAADTDHDGALTLAEFVADADRFFVQLDRGKDGEIDPDDIDYYETVLAPEIRTGGEMGGGIGGGDERRGRGGGGEGRRGGGGGGPPGGGGGPPGGGARPSGGGDGGDNGGSSGKSTARYADTRRGAALYSFFDYPEPVVVADTNFNRGIDPREFRVAAVDRFHLLDKNNDGRITMSELPRLAAPPRGAGGRGGKGGKGRPPGPPPGAKLGGGDAESDD